MNLVVQGAALAPAALAKSRRLPARSKACAGSKRVALCRERRTRVWAVVHDHQVDFAWVPDERRLAICVLLRWTGLDVVTIESIDEMGDLLGIRPQTLP